MIENVEAGPVHRVHDEIRTPPGWWMSGYYGIREMVQDLIWLSANDIWLQFTLQISTVSKHRLGNFNMATLITRTWKTSLSLSRRDIVIYSNWVRFKNNVNKYDKIFKTLAAVTSAGITIDRSVQEKIRCQMRERAVQVRVTVLY